ncbi:MAG: DUF1579 family protein [Candidatus Polarisedimenticolia bacterium]
MTTLLGAYLSVVLAAAAPSLDDLIARHIDSHGGAAKWREVQTLKMSGTMTSWSKKAPFTLVKTRDGKYHLDGVQDEQKLEIGYDGTTAWWDNRMMQEGAQKVRGADLPVILRETDFPTPFFDYKEKKHEVKLLGPKAIEGRDALAIEVKRADGLSETWYLDPKTCLEIARESPGSDFGRPVPQQTFYEDFRKVNGITLPFRIDSQWYTRERALEIESIEMNVPVEEARFKLPPPAGMGPLQPLAGEWKVTFKRRQGDGAPWQDGERASRIEALLGGALLQERYLSGEGSEVLRSFTFDRYRKKYRITDINEQQTYLDILDGDFDESKKLVATDVTTGTPALMFGMTIHGRVTVHEIAADTFKLDEDYSIDGGTNWINVLQATYTRKK